MQILHDLFSITGLLGVWLLHMWQLLRARWHMQKFICVSLVNKKNQFPDSHVFSIRIYACYETIRRGYLLTFYKMAGISRTFISFLSQLPHRSFLK